MSHTDKDRPFWVKLNDESTTTYHRHDTFGRVHTRSRPVRDDHNQLVYETIDVSTTPNVILSVLAPYNSSTHSKYRFYGYRVQRTLEMLSGDEQARLIALARYRIFTNHRRYDDIKIGEAQRLKYETVETVTVLDYCTAGEKLTSRADAWYGILPCTPDWEPGNRRLMYTRDKSGPKASYSKVREGHSRLRARDTLRAAAKHYNAGYEAEDLEDDIHPLTNQHRHSMAWDLY